MASVGTGSPSVGAVFRDRVRLVRTCQAAFLLLAAEAQDSNPLLLFVSGSGQIFLPSRPDCILVGLS